jgi:hypothetical protein
MRVRSEQDGAGTVAGRGALAATLDVALVDALVDALDARSWHSSTGVTEKCRRGI